MSKIITQKDLTLFNIEKVPGLSKVEEELYRIVSDGDEVTKKICTDLISAGGKRIRPLLVLCTSQCFGELKDEVIQTATAYEIIHMASLVHDDVIDGSVTRRNKPTANAQIGNQKSILVGDYLFAKAFKIMAQHRLFNSMSLGVEAISQMCDGEISQEKYKFHLNQTMDDYYNRIYKKTGIFIEKCCQCGAILGGGSEDQIRALQIYGKNIGYAFQIIDDLLDFVGNEQELGKPVGSDLRDGNITLPVLKLIRQDEYRKWFHTIMDREGLDDQYYGEILRLLKDSYALEETYHDAEICIEKAKNALDGIEDSVFKKSLMDLADMILKRKN